MSAAPSLASALLLGLILAACAPTAAPADPVAEAEEIPPVTLTLFGERLMLFMEHPRLVRGESGRFLAHLTTTADGEAVREGRVTLVAGEVTLHVDAPRRDGLYTPEGTFPTAGSFPATLTVETPAFTERLDLGTMTVHPSGDAARAQAAGEPEGPADAVPFLLEQQWQLRTRFAQAQPATLTQRLHVPARTMLAEGAAAIVAAPVAGRLVAAHDELPRTGDVVADEQVLAAVEPPLSAPDFAQLRVLELDLARQRVEIERSLAEAQARADFARREHERLGKLRSSGLATQQQLDEAVQNLAIAQGGVAAAVEVKEALGSWSSRQPGNGVPSETPLQVVVRAPLAGTVLEAGRLLGESVSAGEALFRIADPSRLWVEGRVSEFDIAGLGGQPRARATFAALPEGGAVEVSRLVHVSPEVDSGSRTVAVRFELPNADGALRAGMQAELELEVGRVEAAVVIPFAAVVMDRGQPTAYVMLGGESFQERRLRLGARDGDLVQVLEGVAAGEHVAASGAESIRLASLSPAAFGHGHAH